MDAPEETRGYDEGDLLVLDQVGHDLDDGCLDLLGQIERSRPVNRCVRVPLAGDRLGVDARRQVRPDEVFFFNIEMQGRTTCLDESTTRGETPGRPWPRERFLWRSSARPFGT